MSDPVDDVEQADYVLILNDNRLELHHGPGCTAATSPLYVDFCSGAPYYRFIHDRTIKQPLARAIGIKKGYRPKVLDATAGFGEDSFVLAALGCAVTMLERSGVIWALLDDGIRRALSHPAVGKVFFDLVTLVHADAKRYLHDHRDAFDTIYLDPMYPHSSRSALNKQKMRFLRNVVGDDTDCSELLETALTHAEKRVVVKRPLKAEFLADLQPSFSQTGKSSRYDIYLAGHL